MIKNALLLLALFTMAGTPAQPLSLPAGTDGPQAQLRKLLADSDEANLQRNPMQALYRGDPRYADRFGDYISDEYFAAERRAALDDLAALERIDRAALPAPTGSATMFSATSAAWTCAQPRRPARGPGGPADRSFLRHAGGRSRPGLRRGRRAVPYGGGL